MSAKEQALRKPTSVAGASLRLKPSGEPSPEIASHSPAQTGIRTSVLRPRDVLLLQRRLGNRSVGRLLAQHAPTPTSPPPASLQRDLDPAEMRRLETHLGRNKTSVAQKAGQLEYFAGLTNSELERYRGMRNDAFDSVVKGMAPGMLKKLLDLSESPAQLLDTAGAAMETGEGLAEVTSFLGMAETTMSGLAKVDTGAEGSGGLLSGAKDTYEGVSSAKGQGKYVEGGLMALSGLSGLAGLIPGVPDAAGMISAGAKTAAGVTKIANTAINASALKKLKSDAAGNANCIAAAEVLEGLNTYRAGIQQTVLSGAEFAASGLGTVGKWGVTLASKAAEPVMGWGAYLGRAALSSITSRVSSNKQMKEDEEKEKAAGAGKMRAAVSSTADATLIGRLHRLAVLIEPDFAEEIDRAVELLPDDTVIESVKDAIKKAATWNPS